MMNLQDTWTPMARTAVLTALCLLASLTTKATHLVGGEMYYDHLGGDNYEVHLIIYRDCGPTNTLSLIHI